MNKKQPPINMTDLIRVLKQEAENEKKKIQSGMSEEQAEAEAEIEFKESILKEFGQETLDFIAEFESALLENIESLDINITPTSSEQSVDLEEIFDTLAKQFNDGLFITSSRLGYTENDVDQLLKVTAPIIKEAFWGEMQELFPEAFEGPCKNGKPASLILPAFNLENSRAESHFVLSETKKMEDESNNPYQHKLNTF